LRFFRVPPKRDGDQARSSHQIGIDGGRLQGRRLKDEGTRRRQDRQCRIRPAKAPTYGNLRQKIQKIAGISQWWKAKGLKASYQVGEMLTLALSVNFHLPLVEGDLG
jgi:hypothetical protein